MNIDRYTSGKQFKTFKELKREHDKFQDYSIKCSCGHSIIFISEKDRIICSVCGKYIYRNKKVEMKYKLKKLIKEVK